MFCHARQLSEPLMRLWPFYSEDTIELVGEKIRSGKAYLTGDDPDVARLERDFGNRYGSPLQGVFVSSGTGALEAAYAALCLKRGDEVVVPTNTFRATVSPLLQLTATVRLYGSAFRTRVDEHEIISLINSRTRCVVITHLWGFVQRIDQVRAACRHNGIALIEDCSHAHFSTQDGDYVGSQADIAVLSVGTKKLVSGGMGGMLVTRSEEKYRSLVHYTQPGPRIKDLLGDKADPDKLAAGNGRNLRGSPLAAVMCLDHLRREAVTTRWKQQNCALLSAHLRALFGDAVEAPFDGGGGASAVVPYSFPVRVRDDEVATRFAKYCNVSPRFKRHRELLHLKRAMNLFERSAECAARTNDEFRNVFLFDTRDMFDSLDISNAYSFLAE